MKERTTFSYMLFEFFIFLKSNVMVKEEDKGRVSVFLIFYSSVLLGHSVSIFQSQVV